MDPLTHGLVGVALSTFSGTIVGIDNPITMGAMLGAMSPDLDFVIRIFKDDAAYLEHHRGISHTVPFLAGFSLAITLLLSSVGFAEFSFLSTFIWTFIGAMSHTGLDILNSYGAKFIKKKVKINILTLYDPVITILGLYLVIKDNNSIVELVGAVIIVFAYLFLRIKNKKSATHTLQTFFESHYSNVSVHVMPALKSFYKWDFVVHTSSHNIVGSYNPWQRNIDLNQSIKIVKVLELNETCYYEVFKSTTVGEIFTGFSPNLHINVSYDEATNHIVLQAIDLRYYFKENFMHHATLVVDKELNFISSFLHPYTINKAIPIYQ